MSVTVGTSRSDEVAHPGGADRTLRATADQARAVSGDPSPISPVTGPRVPAQRQGSPAAYVGRVSPPIPKLPSVPQQRGFRTGGGPHVPRQMPRYRYELTGLDDIFSAAEANTDREQERTHDEKLRRLGWKVLLGALIVVVVITVVAAFGVADMLRGATSLVP
jgi:hypothetical protein